MCNFSSTCCCRVFKGESLTDEFSTVLVPLGVENSSVEVSAVLSSFGVLQRCLNWNSSSRGLFGYRIFERSLSEKDRGKTGVSFNSARNSFSD